MKARKVFREEQTMRATGIIRRVDDLGRIVIPKEVRRTLQISEGTPMEFYILPDGITLKVYHPETELLDIVEHFNSVLDNSDDLEIDKIIEVRKHLRAIEAVLKAGE